MLPVTPGNLAAHIPMTPRCLEKEMPPLWTPPSADTMKANESVVTVSDTLQTVQQIVRANENVAHHLIATIDPHQSYVRKGDKTGKKAIMKKPAANQ